MAERIAPSESTLVKYDNPVLVTKHEKRPSKCSAQVRRTFVRNNSNAAAAAPVERQQQQRGAAVGDGEHERERECERERGSACRRCLSRAARCPAEVGVGGRACRGRPSAAPLPAGAQDIPGLLRQGDAHRETDEILNAILPPREWEEDGQLWRQSVSNTPATRLDVINLQEQLDMRLQQRQARETGICPVRRQLYTQCFVSFSQSEQGKADLETTVGTLVKQKSEFERQVVELRAKAEQIERRAKELQQAEEKKHAEEIDFFKRTNQQLKSQLEGIIAPKK
ncbi:Putative inner dynein arm light chain, axonemal [Gryllus bimaculatus]|nr:Putative inner dynein arm light chain, axonemal [Gryllus bimaculatus]